jgi:predicted DNA-binding WGR domain protein
MTWRFERGTRYYRLHLEQDLWGAWCLTRVHGRRGSRLGRTITTCAGTLTDALAALAARAARRRRRGYRLIALN